MSNGLKRIWKNAALLAVVPAVMGMSFPDVANAGRHHSHGRGHNLFDVIEGICIFGTGIAVSEAIRDSNKAAPPPPPPADESFDDDDCLGGGCEDEVEIEIIPSDEEIRLRASIELYWRCPTVNLASGMIEFGADNYATRELPKHYPHIVLKMTDDGAIIDPKHPKRSVANKYVIAAYDAWDNALQAQRIRMNPRFQNRGYNK